MTSTTSTTVTTAKLKSGLVEAHQKVEASLLTSIEAHLQEHSSKAGLDFLHVKNTLFLSYLIDLVVYLKAKLTGSAPNKDNLQRLTEMKVVLDKTRGLDKKLRYQIDKLLQAENAATYATTGGSAEDESSANNNSSSDPLQYRPDPNAFGVDDDSSSSSGSDNDDDDDAGKINPGHEEEENDDDDDLESARRTIALAKESKETSQPTLFIVPPVKLLFRICSTRKIRKRNVKNARFVVCGPRNWHIRCAKNMANNPNRRIIMVVPNTASKRRPPNVLPNVRQRRHSMKRTP